MTSRAPVHLGLVLMALFCVSVGIRSQTFDLPGTQPTNEPGVPASAKIAHLFIPPQGAAPDSCDVCHTTVPDQPARPLATWMGSMMSQSARDPLFYAQLDLTNNDSTIRPAVAGMADMCLRCHSPKGWLEGRSTVLTGLGFNQEDLFGVQCHVCHRLVDPTLPAADPDHINILTGLTALGAFGIPPTFGNGMYVMDPKHTRRGPYSNAQMVAEGFPTHAEVVPDTIAWAAVGDVGVTPHPAMNSAFHRSGNLCGTCHDVSNPADCLAGFTGSNTQKCFPIERTWTEWRHSAFFARGEAGNCQSCHMSGPLNAVAFGSPCEGGHDLGHLNDIHFHDLTGGNAFIPAVIKDMKQRFDTCVVGTPACDNFKAAVQALYPTGASFFSNVDVPALDAGVERVKRTLRRAAFLDAPAVSATDVTVRVTNRTGHKLPTGYPEGRRMWLNARFFNATGTMIAESGRYEDATGTLFHDQSVDGVSGPKSYDVLNYTNSAGATIAGSGRPTKVWEARVERTGPPVVEFHFALNDSVKMDNRIPPEGWNAAAYTDNRASPVIPPVYTTNGWQAAYAAGAFNDEFTLPLPAGADRVALTLNYQTASREYIEALRDDNPNTLTGGGFNRGTLLHDAWQRVGRSAPVKMDGLVRAIVDSDGDLLSDGWETDHLLAGAIDGGFNDDPDGDGLSNWQEFQRDTDPRDGTSPGVPAGGRPPVDIVLVLDLSGSMNDPAPGTTTPKVQVLKDAVTLFLETWKDYAIAADRIGVVYFRTDAVQFGPAPLLKSFAAEWMNIRTDVLAQTASGWTAMGAGLFNALEGLGSFDPLNPRGRHIILFSNGMQNRSPMLVPNPAFPTFLQLRNQTSADNPDVTGGSNVTIPAPGERDFPLSGGSLVKVHSIGIGVAPNGGGTSWHQMLQKIATQQSGKHNFVTRAFDLEGVFLEGLVQSLRANTLEYVLEADRTIVAGTPEVFEIPVNRTASKMSLLVSWSGEQGLPPALELVRPDGGAEDLGRITRGGTFYRVITRFLGPADEAPGDYGVWKLRAGMAGQRPGADVSARAAADRGSMRVRVHAVLDDAELKYRFTVPATLRVGERLLVSARATEGNRLLKMMDRVTVSAERPRTWLGAELARSRYRLDDPGSLDPDLTATPYSQKVRAAFANDAFRRRLDPEETSIVLADTGADGDATAGDGLFSRILTTPTVPGHYRFQFTMSGHTGGGDRFVREETHSLFVRLGPIDPGRTRIRRVTDGGKEYVLLTPTDTAGNLLGPGYTSDLVIRAGARQLPVEDLLDGRYRAPLPAGFAPGDSVAITLDGEKLHDSPVQERTLFEAFSWWIWLLILLLVLVAIVLIVRWLRA